MKKNKYLLNEELIPEIMRYKETGIASEKFGEQLLLLATQISKMPRFAGYTWRDDMISLAVLTCLKYGHNFDPDKSSNPFAYFTRVIYRAFKAYLNTQKKHSNIKKECYNKMELVDESDPYKSIDYSQLKRWDEVEK